MTLIAIITSIPITVFLIASTPFLVGMVAGRRMLSLSRPQLRDKGRMIQTAEVLPPALRAKVFDQHNLRNLRIYLDPYANSSIISANLVHEIRFLICRLRPYQNSDPRPIINVPIFCLEA